MSLNWDWKDKLGELVITDGNREWNIDVYAGNALAIFVYNYTDEQGEKMYQLHNFFADREHLKNMLGMGKGSYKHEKLEYFSDWRHLKLNTAYKRTADIVQLLAKAHVDVTIELYYDPNEFSQYK